MQIKKWDYPDEREYGASSDSRYGLGSAAGADGAGAFLPGAGAVVKFYVETNPEPEPSKLVAPASKLG